MRRRDQAASPVIAEAVSAVIAIGSARPSLKLAAQALQTSTRTLQRRLNAAGVSFSEILERSVAARACDLLLSSGEDIKTISKQLGYRDPSSFSRAFRRWTGESPHEYRSHQNGRAAFSAKLETQHRARRVNATSQKAKRNCRYSSWTNRRVPKGEKAI